MTEQREGARAIAREVVFAVFALFVASAVWLVVLDVPLWPRVYAYIAAGLPALVLGTVIHEAAHAIVAWALGWPILSFDLGVGPVAVERRWGMTDVRLRAVPLHGSVAYVPSRRAYRGGVWIVTIAGPAVNLALVALLIAVASPRDGSWTGLVAGAAIVANLWLAAQSLNPMWGLTTSGYASDGYQLLTLPFRRREWVDACDAYNQVAYGLHLARHGDPTRAIRVVEPVVSAMPHYGDAALQLAAFRIDVGDFAGAGALLDGLAPETVSADLDPWVRNLTAWCALRTNQRDRFATLVPGLRDTLGRMEAAHPLRAAVEDTLGELLVRTGEVADGEALLRRVVEDPKIAAKERAFTACSLARAAIARGEDPRPWLDRARGYDPANPVLAELEAP